MSETPTNPIPEQLPDEPLMADHTYDGIQEYDNPLPGWWKGLFWLTALFAIPYTIWYHFMGNEIYERYDNKLAEIEAAEALIEKLDDSQASLLAMLDDADVVAKGRGIFNGKGACFACHLADGGGVTGLGPNMTDQHYKNLKTLGEFPTVIRSGVLGTAMAPYAKVLSHNEIVQVAVYVASLRGTTPANAKEPEGEIIPAWGEG